MGSDEKALRDLMETINKVANKINIEGLAVIPKSHLRSTKPVISATAIGIAAKQNYITSSGAKPGDDVIVTKFLGFEALLSLHLILKAI